MPRPFAVIGISFFLTLTALSRVSESVAVAILVTSLLAFILLLTVKKFRRNVVFLSACISVAVATGLFLSANGILYKPAISMSGSTVSLTGIVTEMPQQENDRYYYLVKTEIVGNKKMKMKIRFSSKAALDVQAYDQITVDATLYTLGENSEDSLRYYKTIGIFLGAYSINENIVVENITKKPIMYYVYHLKQRLTESILKVLPNENGGLIVALLFGNKSYLSENAISNFRTIGISHITAVSGLHLSVLLLVCLNIFDRFKIGKRTAHSGSIVFVLLFMALAGFSFSVLRAGFMLLVMLAGKLLNREADSINSIGFAVLLITLANPFAAGYIGLQLSFFATLGIITTQKRLMAPCDKILAGMNDSNIKKLLHSTIDTVMITVAATVFVLPISLVYFGRLSLISVLSNLLLVFAASAAMTLGGIAAVFFIIPGTNFVAYPLSYVAGMFAKAIIKGAEILSKLPFADVNMSHNFVYIWLACSLITFAFALILYKKSDRNNLGLAATLCLVTLIIAVISNSLYNKDTVRITVVDSGNISASIISNKHKAALIGCGGDKYAAKKITDSLEENDINTLDYLLIPRTTDTESKAAYDIVSHYNPKMTIVPELNGELDFLEKSESVTIAQRASAQLWKDSNVVYLFNENLSCAYAEISGTSVLFLFYPGCNVGFIPPNWGKADILICRSKPPDDLNLTGFKTVVISTDKQYLPRGSEYGAEPDYHLFSTAGQGNIIIKVKKNSGFSIGRER